MLQLSRLRRFGPAVVGLSVLFAVPGAHGEPVQSTFTLRVSVMGSGAVTIPARRIGCRTQCSAELDAGTIVELKAVPSAGFVFRGWSRDCFGTANWCAVALDEPMTVEAVFVGEPRRVRMTVGGPGTIVSKPKGLTCGRGGAGCDATFQNGTIIRLSPARERRRSAVVWGGACRAVRTRTCKLFVGADMEISAAVRRHASVPGRKTLTVRFAGPGQVTSDPAGIDCPGACQQSLPRGAIVTLRASSGPLDWKSGCVGTGSMCIVALNASVTVDVARAAHPAPGFGINVSVGGRGLVVGRGIRCGATSGRLLDCENFFSPGTTVVLQAVPGEGVRLARWGGFCSGTDLRCSLRATAPKIVFALFRR